jgi:hypothetical protein
MGGNMNKPVAWMHQNPDYPILKHWSQEYNIPLYIHPAKTLTHDEIAEIYHSENRFSPQGNFLYYGFARAILRKAQEK